MKLELDPEDLSRERARDALRDASRFHFTGIGGVGMSALARILVRQGKVVSGTDRSDSARLGQMRLEGVAAEVGHRPEAVHGAEVVVVTTALTEDNVELVEARRLDLPVLHRAELLAAVVNQRPSIAVTGTHGKSTTTALVGHLLAAAGLDPLVIVGGDVHEWDGNVRFGRGPWAVFEACESDGTLLLYRDACQIITSLEPDHLDRHRSFAALRGTVARFAASADPDGFVVYNADSETVREAVRGCPAPVLGYGRTAGEYHVGRITLRGRDGLGFTLLGPSGGATATTTAYGEHNACNAAAALAAAQQAGVQMGVAVEALASFRGVVRRFELLGRLGESEVYDDYAHHPTEVRATLRAAKQHLARPVLVVFQPHLYSRTRDLMGDFVQSFGDADDVIITRIYAAREEPIPGVTGEALAEGVAAQRGPRPTRFVADFDDIVELVRPAYRDGWTILVMGAGDIREVGERLAKEG